MPRRERYLWVCENVRAAGDPKGSCSAAGAAGVLEALKRSVVERGLHKRVRVCGSSCLDLCAEGPAIAVMPDGVFYGRVCVEDVPDIVDSLERACIVSRLSLSAQALGERTKGGG